MSFGMVTTSFEPCHVLLQYSSVIEEKGVKNMSNLDKYVGAFTSTFMVEESALPELKYQGIPAWDSVGHMALIAALEEAFAIEMDIDDIIDFSSFEVGKKMLSKYNVVVG